MRAFFVNKIFIKSKYIFIFVVISEKNWLIESIKAYRFIDLFIKYRKLFSANS